MIRPFEVLTLSKVALILICLDAEGPTVIFLEFIMKPKNSVPLSEYTKHPRFEINSTISNTTFLHSLKVSHIKNVIIRGAHNLCHSFLKARNTNFNILVKFLGSDVSP